MWQQNIQCDLVCLMCRKSERMPQNRVAFRLFFWKCKACKTKKWPGIYSMRDFSPCQHLR